MLTIVALDGRPDLVPIVARWHWNEWGHGDPDGSLATWTDGLRQRADSSDPSVTWVALADGVPAGSVALIESDMATHPELSPWLSGVFVVPRFRGRGIGAKLVRHCEGAARARDVGTLYLYTTTAEGWYRALGWRAIARQRYGSEDVSILAKTLRRRVPQKPAAASCR